MMLTHLRYVPWIMLAGVLAFSRPASADPADEHPIKIGAFLSLSGPASRLGEPARNTLAMKIDQLNAQGGVLGRPLRWIAYDAGDDALKARTAVKRLIEQDRVDLIIGGSTTATALVVLPLIEQAGIAWLALAGTAALSEPVKKWVFPIPPSERLAVTTLFADLQQRALHRIALLSATDSFGRAARQQARALAGDYGLEIVAEESYHSYDQDTLAPLSRIRSTPGVQAVLTLGTGQGPLTVTRQYRQLDLPWPLYQSHGVVSPQSLEWGQTALDGVRLPAGLLLIAEQLPEGHPQKAVLETYRRAYQWRYHTPASPLGGYAHDALGLAVAAIERAGTTEKESVRRALESIQGYGGVSGRFSFSPTDHQGLGQDALTLIELRQGALVALDQAPLDSRRWAVH